MRIVVHLAWRLQPAHDPDGMRRVNVVGTSRVLDAIARAGVPALVHASSVGPTPPGPPKTLGALSPRVRENHPTLGISTSTCSRHKAEADRMLGASEAGHPERRGVRLRPGVVLQAEAASALARCFLGLFVPQTLVRPSLVPLSPRSTGWPSRWCTRRTCPPAYVLHRAAHAAAGHHVGTHRARLVAGHDAGQALLETLEAMRAGVGVTPRCSTPVLHPRGGLSRRAFEVVRALVPDDKGTG